jgi:hypothetical protein
MDTSTLYRTLSQAAEGSNNTEEMEAPVHSKSRTISRLKTETAPYIHTLRMRDQQGTALAILAGSRAGVNSISGRLGGFGTFSGTGEVKEKEISNYNDDNDNNNADSDANAPSRIRRIGSATMSVSGSDTQSVVSFSNSDITSSIKSSGSSIKSKLRIYTIGPDSKSVPPINKAPLAPVPIKASKKAFVYGGAARGLFRPLGNYYPTPIPNPPVRPESLAGFGTVSLRPFPPYLLKRFYLNAALNPSPAFRVRFFKLSAPMLMHSTTRASGNGASGGQLQRSSSNLDDNLISTNIHSSSLDASRYYFPEESAQSDSLILRELSVEERSEVLAALSIVQQTPDELRSGEETDFLLTAGKARCVSDSDLIMVSAPVRRTLASALDWSVLVPGLNEEGAVLEASLFNTSDFIQENTKGTSHYQNDNTTSSLPVLRSHAIPQQRLDLAPFRPTQRQRIASAAEVLSGPVSLMENYVGFFDQIDSFWKNIVWTRAWEFADIESLGGNRAGLRLCSCGCGKQWGRHSAFPKYSFNGLGGVLRGHAANGYDGSAEHVIQQIKSGHCSTLLQHPQYPFGGPSIVLDLSSWALDHNSYKAIAQHAPFVRVFTSSPWQGPFFSNNTLIYLLPLMFSLRHLHLPGCDGWGDDEACKALAASSACPQLLSLDVSLSSITDIGLSYIAERCHSLLTLNVSSCPKLSERSILLVGKRCAKLEALDLSWNLRLKSEGIASILAECHDLKRLSLRGLGRGYISDKTSKLASAAVGDGLGGRPFLLHRVMDARAEILMRVREVDLEGCVGVSDAVVITLARNCEGTIERLRLSQCPALTAASTTAIAMFCPMLTHLFLLGCTNIHSPIFDNTIAATLAVQSGRDRAGGVIPDPSKSFGTGFGVANLMLQLDNTGPRSGTADVPDAEPASRPSVHFMGETKPQKPKWTLLKMLDLTGCGMVIETDILGLIQGCPDLFDVRISGCYNVSDIMFASFPIANALQQLQSLSIAYLPAVSDSTLECIAGSCPNLQSLDITGCTGFTESAILSLSSHCFHLRELRAQGCSESIKLACILQLAKCCRLLRVLEFGRALIQDTNNMSASETDSRVSHIADGLTVPPGYDSSFEGDMFDLLLCFGVACPFLEQLDLTGRRPAAGKRQDATSIGDSFMKGNDNVMSLFAAARSLHHRSSVDAANSEIVFPHLNRLVLRCGGLLTPKQLESLLRISPNLLSLDVTDVEGITVDILETALGHAASTRTPETEAVKPNAKVTGASYTRIIAYGSRESEAYHERTATRMASRLRSRESTTAALKVRSGLRKTYETPVLGLNFDVDLQRPIIDPIPFSGGTRHSLPMTPAVPVNRLRKAAADIPKIGTAGVVVVSISPEDADTRDTSDIQNRTDIISAKHSSSLLPSFGGVLRPHETFPHESLVRDVAEELLYTRSGVLSSVIASSSGSVSNSIRVLGFEPIPGACFLRDASIFLRRFALERISANRIRKVVRHGLRKPGGRDWLWALRSNVRNRILARFQYSARRIQRCYRAYTEVQFWKRHLGATVIAMWFRRILFIDRCRQRIIRALEIRRAAQVKQLACALLSRILERTQVRMAWDKFRMNSLIERWRDERRANRLRGLAPVYGNDGKLKVQIVFPSEGDEVLGAKEEMMQQVNALEVILRSTYAAPPKGLLNQFLNEDDIIEGNKRGELNDSIDDLVGLGPGLTSDQGPRLDDNWEYAYAYRYEGLQLVAPRRVRRRKSLSKKMTSVVNNETLIQNSSLSTLSITSSKGGKTSSVIHPYHTISQDLVRTVPKVDTPKASSGKVSRAERRMPMRPHRPRRNSFDLLALSRIDPDENEYSDGWETCDDDDAEYQQVFGFFDDEGREMEAAAIAEVQKDIPESFGVASTFALFDAADDAKNRAELEKIEADFNVEASLEKKAKQREQDILKLHNDRLMHSNISAESSISSTSSLKRQSYRKAPQVRPETAMDRRVRRTRDFYLRKLARLHLLIAQCRNEDVNVRRALYLENITDQEIRTARDAYEATHGEGSSLLVQEWRKLDIRMRNRITAVFALENRQIALEREAATTAVTLKNLDRRLLLQRSGRELRDSAVNEARSADPSLLVLDFGSSVFRLADDALSTLATKYKSADSAILPYLSKSHDEPLQHQLAIVEIKSSLLPPREGVSDFLMPSLKSQRPGGLGPSGRPGGLPESFSMSSTSLRPFSSSRVRLLPIKFSPYAILPGGVRILLPNPDGLGGASTESFGTGPKRTLLAKTLQIMGISHETSSASDFLKPLVSAIKPLEQLKRNLGSVGAVQKSKRMFPVEISKVMNYKKTQLLLKDDMELGSARRLRLSFARRIQKSFKAYLKRKKLRKEMDDFHKESTLQMMTLLRAVGKAEEPNCASAAWQEIHAAVTIQARFRVVSAKIFYFNARRILAVTRAKTYLTLMGIALDAPDPDEYIRAHVLAGEAARELQIEQDFTGKLRRTSKQFDRQISPFLDTGGRTIVDNKSERSGSISKSGSRQGSKKVVPLTLPMAAISPLGETEPQRVLRLLGNAISSGMREDLIEGTDAFAARVKADSSLVKTKIIDQWGGEVEAMVAIEEGGSEVGDDDGRSGTEKVLRRRKVRKAKDDPLRLLYNELSVLLSLDAGRQARKQRSQLIDDATAHGAIVKSEAVVAPVVSDSAERRPSYYSTYEPVISAEALQSSTDIEASKQASNTSDNLLTESLSNHIPLNKTSDTQSVASVRSRKSANGTNSEKLPRSSAIDNVEDAINPPRMSQDEMEQERREVLDLDLQDAQHETNSNAEHRSEDGSSFQRGSPQGSVKYGSVGSNFLKIDGSSFRADSETNENRSEILGERSIGGSELDGIGGRSLPDSVLEANANALLSSNSPLLLGACQRLLMSPEDPELIIAVSSAMRDEELPPKDVLTCLALSAGLYVQTMEVSTPQSARKISKVQESPSGSVSSNNPSVDALTDDGLFSGSQITRVTGKSAMTSKSNAHRKAALRALPVALARLYDADILDEDTVFEWFDTVTDAGSSEAEKSAALGLEVQLSAPLGGNVSQSDKPDAIKSIHPAVLKAMTPFVEWLRADDDGDNASEDTKDTPERPDSGRDSPINNSPSRVADFPSSRPSTSDFQISDNNAEKNSQIRSRVASIDGYQQLSQDIDLDQTSNLPQDRVFAEEVSSVGSSRSHSPTSDPLLQVSGSGAIMNDSIEDGNSDNDSSIGDTNSETSKTSGENPEPVRDSDAITISRSSIAKGSTSGKSKKSSSDDGKSRGRSTLFGSMKSKKSAASKELKKRAMTRAAKDEARRQAYYAGQLAQKDLVAYRRELNEKIFTHNIKNLQFKALYLEGVFLNYVAESIPCMADDYVFRFKLLSSEGSSWALHWQDVLGVMMSQREALPHVCDPFALLRKARLDYRIKLLGALVDVRKDQSERMSDIASLYESVRTWSERVMKNILARRFKDEAMVKRVERQMPSAEKVLEFLRRRKNLLKKALEAFQAGGAKARIASELMMHAIGNDSDSDSSGDSKERRGSDRGLGTIREESDSDGSGSESEGSADDISRDERRQERRRKKAEREERRRRRREQRAQNSEADESDVSPGESSSDESGSDLGSDSHESGSDLESRVSEVRRSRGSRRKRRGDKNPNDYDWEGTDEWAIASDAVGRVVYKHVLSGFATYEIPTQPPEGYEFLRYKDSFSALSPRLIPTAVGTDEPMAPLERGPTFVPTSISAEVVAPSLIPKPIEIDQNLVLGSVDASGVVRAKDGRIIQDVYVQNELINEDGTVPEFGTVSDEKIGTVRGSVTDDAKSVSSTTSIGGLWGKLALGAGINESGAISRTKTTDGADWKSGNDADSVLEHAVKLSTGRSGGGKRERDKLKEVEKKDELDRVKSRNKQVYIKGALPGTPGGPPAFPITNAVGNGAIVTYTCLQNFSPGDLITIRNINPPTYNMPFATILEATSKEFKVVSRGQGEFVREGALTKGGIAAPMQNRVYAVKSVEAVPEKEATLSEAGVLIPAVPGYLIIKCDNDFVPGAIITMVGVVPALFNVENATVVKQVGTKGESSCVFSDSTKFLITLNSRKVPYIRGGVVILIDDGLGDGGFPLPEIPRDFYAVKEEETWLSKIFKGKKKEEDKAAGAGGKKDGTHMKVLDALLAMGLTDEDTTTSEDPSVQDSLMLGQKVNKKNAPGSVPVEGDPTKSTSNSSNSEMSSTSLGSESSSSTAPPTSSAASVVSSEATTRIASKLRKRAQAREGSKNAFDEFEVKSELRWIDEEARLIHACITRMENYLQAIFIQHAKRAASESQTAYDLQLTLEKLVTACEEQRRVETELLQVQFEIRANEFANDNKLAIETLAKSNAESFVSFGRTRALTMQKGGAKDSTTWSEAKEAERNQQLEARKGHVQARSKRLREKRSAANKAKRDAENIIGDNERVGTALKLLTTQNISAGKAGNDARLALLSGIQKDLSVALGVPSVRISVTRATRVDDEAVIVALTLEPPSLSTGDQYINQAPASLLAKIIQKMALDQTSILYRQPFTRLIDSNAAIFASGSGAPVVGGLGNVTRNVDEFGLTKNLDKSQIAMSGILGDTPLIGTFGGTGIGETPIGNLNQTITKKQHKIRRKSFIQKRKLMLAQKLALQRSRAEELNESFIASKDDSLPPTPDSSKSDAFLFPSNAEPLIKSNAASLSKRSLEPIENTSHLFSSVNHNVSTSFSKSATGAISETEVDDAIDGDDEEDYDVEEILRSGNVPAAVKEDPLYLEMRRKQRLAKRKRDAKLLKKQGKIAQARQQTVRDIKEDGILSSTTNQLVPVPSVSNTSLNAHGETQFVPGGAMSAGFTYGTVKGGRFGRFIRKAADILKETEAKEAEEAAKEEKIRIQNMITEGLANQVAQTVRQVECFSGELAELAEFKRPLKPPPGIDLKEWVVPPFRPAVVPKPSLATIAYYSIGSDGEEIGNPAFYYWGRDKGTIVGLFGLHMRLGVVGGYLTGEESQTMGEETDDEVFKPEPPISEYIHGRKVAAARAEVLKKQREERRSLRKAALEKKLKEESILASKLSSKPLLKQKSLRKGMSSKDIVSFSRDQFSSAVPVSTTSISEKIGARDQYVRVTQATEIELVKEDGHKDSYIQQLKIGQDAMQFIDPSWLNLTTSVILTDKVHRDKYFDYERKKYGSQDPKENILAEDPSSIGPVVAQSFESVPITTAQDLDSSALPLSRLSLNRDSKAAVSSDSVSTIPPEKHQQQDATKVEIVQHNEADDEGGNNELEDEEDSDIDDVNVFAQYTPDRAQAERDAADNPAWWSQINFPDDTVSSNSNAPNNDSDDFNSRQVDPSKAYRGFGRGILCAKTASEYSMRLAAQEVSVQKRLGKATTEREILQVKVHNLTAELEKQTETWKPYEFPPPIKRVIQESIDALDAPLRRKWEKEFEQKVRARKRTSDLRDIEKKKNLGIYNEEEERKKKEEADLKRAEDLAMGLEVPDEFAEFRTVRQGEEFKSLGFLAIVANDGSLLEWAGNGAQFLLSSWRARYRVKPWIVDSALIEFIASKQDSIIKAEADLANMLMAEGSTAIIRAYKLGGESLPLSGLELAKQQLVGKHAADAAAAALAAASRLEATKVLLQKLMADRKAQRDEEKRQKDEKRRQDEILANQDLSERLDNVKQAAKDAYEWAQKEIAEWSLRRDESLRNATKAVLRDNQSALGLLEGIAEFHFTFGVFQDHQFATDQRKNFEERKPFFLKFPFNLAGGAGGSTQDILADPAYMWYRRTIDISEMITDIKWAPYQGDAPLTQRLLANEYTYVTNSTIFPTSGLWTTRGSGRPISSMTITFDASRIKLMEGKGFSQIEGTWASEILNPNAKFWFKASRQRRVKTEADVEVVIRTEKAAAEAKIAQMEAKVKLAQDNRKKNEVPTQEQVQQMDALHKAKVEYAQQKATEAEQKEDKLAAAAIEFMGIPEDDVADLKKAFELMDTDRSGSVDLPEFFAFVDIERTPIAESIFFFLDASFNETISWGTFLRTVCTFAMFGAKEMITWVFSVVAANTVGRAEKLHPLPVDGRAGARGIDSRNRSVYWEDAVAWSGITTSDTQGKISTVSFKQLLYNIHPPTSAFVTTVKRAISKAEKLSVGGQMRLFQFRQIVAEFPTLLSPIFLMQSRMRDKFLGEEWWDEKRELFVKAREIVQQQLAVETRQKLSAREAARANAKAEAKLKDAKEKKRKKELASGGMRDTNLGSLAATG